MTKLFWTKTLILCICLTLAIYHDVREKKIKNVVTLPTALLGLILNLLEGGLAGLYTSLVGWVIPVLGLFLLYQINVLGAGDIKLFAAIGALMGTNFVIYSFAFSVFFGGGIALLILLKRRELLQRLKYLLNYGKLVFFTQRLSAYCAPADVSAKFIFSVAIVPGTILQLLFTIRG